MLKSPLAKKAILLAAILLIPAIAQARIIDKIIAVVNDEVITQSEVDRLLYPIYLQYKNIYHSEEEVLKRLDSNRVDILNQLIGDKLILGEAKKLGIVASESEVDRKIDGLKKDVEAEGSTMYDMLAAQNMTLADVRKKFTDQLMIQGAIEINVSSRIIVQPSEIDSYYRGHIDDYTHHAEVALYSILIKINSVRTALESRQLAGDIHKMVKEGADFKETAKNYTEGPNKDTGGDLGFVKRGQLLEELDNVIFFLKDGEISDVIESPIGYHICMVYDRKEEKVIEFKDVREKVAETLYRNKAQLKYDDWLDELKKDAYISIK